MGLTEVVREKKGVLFDLWHTLACTEHLPPDGTSSMDILGVGREEWLAALLGCQDAIHGRVREPLMIIRTLARSLNKDVSEEAISRCTQRYISRHEKALIGSPAGSVHAVRGLKASGKRLGLVSNALAPEVQAWPRSPLAEHFDEAIFSCDVGLSKPDPRIFQTCLKRLNLKAADCLYVGDGGSRELEAARALGMSTVMVAGFARTVWAKHLDERMKAADFVVEEVKELLA